MPHTTHNWKGIAAVAAASALFGTIGLFVHALDEVGFTGILAYRFTFSALGFGALALASATWRRRLLPRRGCTREYVMLGVLTVLMDLAYYWALITLGMALATILLATAPAFVTLANWLVWNTRPDWRVFAGMSVGLAGIVLVVGASGVNVDLVGVLAGLGAGAAYAAWLLASRVAALKGASASSQAVAAVVLATGIFVPLALVNGVSMPDTAGWLAALALGAGIGVGGYLLLTRGLAMIDAARAGVLTYLDPVTAGFLGVLVLGEPFTPWQLAGTALVIVGMVVVSVTRPRVRRKHARKALKRMKRVPRRKRPWGERAEHHRKDPDDAARSRSPREASSSARSDSSSMD